MTEVEVLNEMVTMGAEKRVVVVPGVGKIRDALFQTLQWPDYVICGVMLFVYLMIGVYFGFFQVSTTVQGYLMGDRKMKILPVSMSLLASFFSGIVLLRIPVETYLYGVQSLFLLLGHIFMTVIVNYVYLPVLYRLRLTSVYEYLEIRFNKNVRIFGSLLFAISMLAWLSVVIRIPGFIFNQVTSINLRFTILILTICILYTSWGGLKAVVWTDAVQCTTLFAVVVLIVVRGSFDVEDFNTMIDHSLNPRQRENPNLNLDTLWSLSVGGCVYYLHSAAINQNMLQRYLSLPSLKSARRAAFLFSFGFCLLFAMCVYCGILIYTTYHQCDPLKTKLAQSENHLLILYFTKILGKYPGLLGIFVTAVFSASLSSFSTGLIAMAAAALEDFYPFFSTKHLTEKQSSLLMKTTVVVFGTICGGLSYFIGDLETAIQISKHTGFIISGPSLGVFTMGILLPWVNAKGVLIGGTSSLIFMIWMSFNSYDLPLDARPLTTRGCYYHFTPQTNFSGFVHFRDSHKIQISYIWYTAIGTLVSVIVGLVASLMVESSDPRDVDPQLLSSLVRKIIKPREFPNEPGDGIIYAFNPNDKKSNVAPLQTGDNLSSKD